MHRRDTELYYGMSRDHTISPIFRLPQDSEDSSAELSKKLVSKWRELNCSNSGVVPNNTLKGILFKA